MRVNHYIMEIYSQTLDQIVNSRYFDGSESRAIAYFEKLDLYKRNKNKEGYLITIRANPIVLTDNRKF